jgi:hypothetical protein
MGTIHIDSSKVAKLDQANVFTQKQTMPELKVTSGASAGKVLTSDTEGNATWQTGGGGTNSTELARSSMKPVNLKIINVTTTDTDDSIKLTGLSGALSVSNKAYIPVPDANGLIQVFEMDADVTFLLTGAHWPEALGDLTDAILRVIAINDSGVLKWGITLQGGRLKILTSRADTVNANILESRMVLVNSTIGTDSPCIEHFWFRTNFIETGGAAEMLWIVQSGISDLNLGNADGQWQVFNPAIVGLSNSPTLQAFFSTIALTAFMVLTWTNWGDSDSTSKTFTLPIRVGTVAVAYAVTGITRDAGVYQSLPGTLEMATNNCTVFKSYGNAAWTDSGTCEFDFCTSYPSGE